MTMDPAILEVLPEYTFLLLWTSFPIISKPHQKEPHKYCRLTIYLDIYQQLGVHEIIFCLVWWYLSILYQTGSKSTAHFMI